MKHISLIVYDDVLPAAVFNTAALLTSANDAAVKRGDAVPFRVELVGAHLRKTRTDVPVQLHCISTIADEFDTDIVIIPPMSTAPQHIAAMLSDHHRLIGWIKEKYQRRAEVISLCTGAYFLAECGLLNGLPATSHWGAMEDLQQRYPLIRFKSDSVVTHANAIITGGGGFSSLNALLYFIENTCGKEISVALSKFYALDYGRVSQSVFTVFSGQRQHNDPEIHDAQRYIEQAFQTDITVEQIARQVNMSKRNFIRRFKNATALNPIEFIQRIKVEAAKKAFEVGETNIAAVTYSVGYNDLKTFRTVFKKITGLTPVEYRNRFNTQLMVH